MKKLIFFAAMYLYSLSLNAQTSANETPLFARPNTGSFLNRFERRELRVAQKLKLDPTQLKSLDDINDTYVTQVASLYDNKNLSKKERKEKISDLKKSRLETFLNMLSPVQLQKWQELRKSKQRKVFRKK